MNGTNYFVNIVSILLAAMYQPYERFLSKVEYKVKNNNDFRRKIGDVTGTFYILWQIMAPY